MWRVARVACVGGRGDSHRSSRRREGLTLFAPPPPRPAPRVHGPPGALIDLLVVLRAAAAERGSRGRARIMTPELTESGAVRAALAAEVVDTRSRVEAAVSRHRMLVEEHCSHEL